MSPLALLLVLGLLARPAQPQDDEQVTKWARELGDELWELGRQIAKPDEIKRASYIQVLKREYRKTRSIHDILPPQRVKQKILKLRLKQCIVFKN